MAHPEVTAAEVTSLAEKALSSRNASLITLEKTVTALCDAYLLLDGREEEQRAVLRFLSGRGVDRALLRRLAAEYAAAAEGQQGQLSRLEEELREALLPPYIWLFKRIGQLEGGVKFLVDLRAQLIPMTRQQQGSAAEEAAALKQMNAQLRQLLGHWFSVGFLRLEQVTWGSPCAMLQKVSDYEAVHPMRNWTDLKARVGPYRRCFVYTHRSMPGEPIVVLHVALTRGIPEKIASVVKHHRLVKRFSVDAVGGGGGHGAAGSSESGGAEDTSTCDSAIFYSITSTQTGLQGIELGTYLIKQAVKRLKEELPGVVHFCTLSPIPGFRQWLLAAIKMGEGDLFLPSELDAFRDHFAAADRAQALGAVADSLRTGGWTADAELAGLLERPLMRLCARYLYLEKHRGNAANSVANFHLRNGAVLWRLNWRADLSARGMGNSCGIMVNYKYFVDDLEANSSAYLETKEVKAGEQVLHLASQCRLGM